MEALKNRITIVFNTTEWKKEFEHACFNEKGHAFSELEDDQDLELISEKEFFGKYVVVLDVKKWIASSIIDMKNVCSVSVENQTFMKGAGRYIADDMNSGNRVLELTLSEVLK